MIKIPRPPLPDSLQNELNQRQAAVAAGADPDADRAVIGLLLYAMPPGVALKLRLLLC